MTPMKSRKARIPAGLRRTLAAVAISAVAVAGWQLNSMVPSGIGVMGLPGATAEPTGPTGGPGGDGGMNGSQFQPPSIPNSMPDYQGGINQPPLDQNNGISIYNTGAQGAPQQAGQQGAQQGNPGQQPQHGNQIPDYQTATPYTQGPGQANPNYQAPQQGNQGQQPQQGQQQQPQNKQDDSTQQLDQKQQKCTEIAQVFGITEFVMTNIGGAAGTIERPGRDVPGAGGDCHCADNTSQPQEVQAEAKTYFDGFCLLGHNEDGSCRGKEVVHAAQCATAIGLALAPLIFPGGTFYKLFKVAKSYRKIAELVRSFFKGSAGRHRLVEDVDKMADAVTTSTMLLDLLKEVAGITAIQKAC